MQTFRLKHQAALSALLFSAFALAQSSPPAPSVPASPPDAAVAAKAPTPADLKRRYPANSIDSAERADRALADVKLTRAHIEKRFKEEEKACYKTFLANQCVTEAKARRRQALAEIKPIQIEADRYKRHQAVVKREQALEQKRLKEEGKPRPAPDSVTRADRLLGKHQQAQQKESGAAEKRAANEAAFERKAANREKTRQKVEERKARTERRRQKKAAAAAKKAQPASVPDDVPPPRE